MKRVAAVLLVALLNALVFGITGSAAPSRDTAQDKEQARQEAILKKAREIAPGTVVRIVRMDGTEVDAILDNVLPDTIDILLVTRTSRTPATVALGSIRSIKPLKGSALKSFAKTMGIGVAALTGLCAVMVVTAGR